MSRYIDAEWLKGRVHDVTLANGALHGCIDKLDIHEAPSIDIVRCKECKHWNDAYICWRRRTQPMAMNPDDFCSYGERDGE